ncbi:MAG: methyltransferase domain-containing protein [Candidatus Obscuribacter sp.]|nr:methyltransferase domain-containing protein [Candidatus Obscuribacter sp.]
MDLAAVSFLLSQAGRAALDELTQTPILPANELKLISSLRKRFDMTTTAALIEAAQARQRAVRQRKYGRADQMFFTRDGLEQSSGEVIANYRARRFVATMPKDARIADLCCGIGGDTIALAQYFDVTGFDLDETRLQLAHANAHVCGVQDKLQVRQSDVTSFDGQAECAAKGNSSGDQSTTIKYDGVFFDPGRRDKNGKRIYDPERYSPPLSTIRNWLKTTAGTAVKVSPGIDYEQLRAAGLDFEVEIISQAGEVKEAVLWLGAFKRPEVARRATLLQGDDVLSYDDAACIPDLPITTPRGYIHEPDGAIIRAGLVGLLGEPLAATKIDPDIAYLTGDTPSDAVTARSFAVLDSMPFSLKKLKSSLQALKCGRVVVKKRGSPLSPEELIKALAIKGDGKELTVILTHLSGTHSAIICEEVKPSHS